VKYSPAGQFLLVWGSTEADPGQFETPEGLGVDSRNNIYVTDTFNDRIEKFSPTGEFEGVGR
jgi:tripartite motif-containing protein 71